MIEATGSLIGREHGSAKSTPPNSKESVFANSVQMSIRCRLVNGNRIKDGKLDDLGRCKCLCIVFEYCCG